MAFDYKKEYKEFYLPKNKPTYLMGVGTPADEFCGGTRSR